MMRRTFRKFEIPVDVFGKHRRGDLSPYAARALGSGAGHGRKALCPLCKENQL